MRLIVIFLFAIGFFVELPVVATAQSNGTIPPATALVITGEQVGGAETRDVAYADLDQDNDVDAFVVEWDHSEIWFNQGNGQYLKGEQKLGDSVQNAVALGDLDEDGDIDAFIAKQDAVLGKPNEVWLNNGKGVFSDSGQRLSADDYSANMGVQLADLDQDQDLDAFVVANGLYCGVNRLWLNDGNGVFSDSGQKWPSCDGTLKLVDLNQDQKVDIILDGHGESSGLTLWNNLGGSVFTKTQLITDTYFIDAVEVGDLDGDGDLDLFTTRSVPQNNNPNSNSTRYNKVWFNNGFGKFTDSGQLLSYSSSKNDVVPWGDAVTLTDVDEDSDLDVIVVSRFVHYGQWAMVENAVVVHFNNGSGRLTQSMITYIPPVAPTSIDRSRIAFFALVERLYLPFIPNGK